jgi:hypothetical protein
MATTQLCTVKEEHSGAACHVAHDTGIQADNSQYPNLVNSVETGKQDALLLLRIY